MQLLPDWLLRTWMWRDERERDVAQILTALVADGVRDRRLQLQALIDVHGYDPTDAATFHARWQNGRRT